MGCRAKVVLSKYDAAAEALGYHPAQDDYGLIANPYPPSKPRLHAAWARGFAVGEKQVICGRGTPCQLAFNGGAQRLIDTRTGT